MIKGLVKRLKGTGLEAELPMLRVPEKVSNVGILVVSSNKGLCGAYNAFVAKKATQRVKELNEQGITPKMVFIGRKGRLGFQSRAHSMTGTSRHTMTLRTMSRLPTALKSPRPSRTSFSQAKLTRSRSSTASSSIFSRPLHRSAPFCL